MDARRSLRVSEAVREELSELIRFELSDPRLTGVDVIETAVSPDGRHAHVKVTVPGDDQAQKRGLSALNHAAKYLRNELAQRLSLRLVPELHFSISSGVDAEGRVDVLLKRAKKLTRPPENQP
jgi:ribosome-binding factor A